MIPILLFELLTVVLFILSYKAYVRAKVKLAFVTFSLSVLVGVCGLIMLANAKFQILHNFYGF